VAIRTPDQRLRVFVSSTLGELADERRAVREAIESLRLTPVVFEQGARPHPPRALYRAYLEQSDVFIGLYWEQYGWVAPGAKVSGLEDEYALAGSRPKLVYIKAPAPKRQSRLEKLIARIQTDDEVSYRRFAKADELRSLVADDLAVLLTESFAVSTAQSKEPARRTGRVPRPLTRLIGREEDVTRVLELLDDPDNRMVTLFGTGGVGKTRLALAVAERAKDRYPDGVMYVELATVTEPSLVIPTIAEALGVEEGAGASLGIRLREALAAAHMLIVLDNMEQLADAAPDLADLLASAAGIQLLVTSRRVLNVRGEHVYTVEPLPVPALDGEITPAVELFIDRAVASRPDFRPTDDDLAAIGELARRLDGLPLAIELASARLRVLSPRAVLERMGDRRLEFLRAGTTDLPERQQTLRNTIAWSHSMLTADAQTLFARLAVFGGSGTLNAIEQVANPDGRLVTLDLLASLVDTSLIRTVGEAAEPRFGMLETIREFAAEQLEVTGVADEYRARHEAYYLELAQRGNIGLGTADQLEWLDRFTRETDNFRAVLRRAVRRDDAAVGVRMGRALATYWHMRGSYSEGRGWMTEVAALPRAGPRERAVAWTIGAFQALGQGDFELVDENLDDALRAALEADDRWTIGFAQLLRAVVIGSSADDQRWRAALSDATASLDAEGEPLLVGLCMLSRSYLARLHGRIDEALDSAQAARDLSVRIGEWYVRMVASALLARASLELDDPAGAHRPAIDSLHAAQRIRNLGFAGYALALWAMAELREGRAERAARLFALAERGYRQAGSRPWSPDAEIHRRLEADLRVALGDRYDDLVAEAREVDFDAAITELATEAVGQSPGN
jgi:predicted ATPase